jgi:hypothetical protein
LFFYFLIGLVLGIATLGILKPDIFNFKGLNTEEPDSTKINLQDSLSVDSSATLIDRD